MDFIKQNWPQIAGAIGALITAASIVAKLTPNKIDNKVLKKIRKVAELVGLNTEPVE